MNPNAPRHRPRVTLPPKGGAAGPRRLAETEEVFDEQPPAPPPPPANAPPATAEEAERRFWKRYGPSLGLAAGKKPATVDEWLRAATLLRDLLTPTAERLADIEDAVRALRELHGL